MDENLSGVTTRWVSALGQRRGVLGTGSQTAVPETPEKLTDCGSLAESEWPKIPSSSSIAVKSSAQSLQLNKVLLNIRGKQRRIQTDHHQNEFVEFAPR